MATYTDDGIVLRRANYGEADRVLTLLLRRRGKVGAIAKGVRKSGSRLGAHTDLFSVCRVQLAVGRGELDVLIQAERVQAVSGKLGPLATACASVCAEFTDRVTATGQPVDAQVFALITDSLTRCFDAQRDPRLEMAWFARRMFDHLGYAPQLFRCAHCSRELSEDSAYFSAVAGGLLCAECSPTDTVSVQCSVRAVKVLRVIAAGDHSLYQRLVIDLPTLDIIDAVVERELAHHIGSRLRAFEVVRTLAKAS